MPYKTNIKICGLTTLDEINIVNSYPIDYVGFVFTKSKREISVQQAKILSNQLRSDIKRVGVFVNKPLEDIKNIQKECNLDIIQLHGDESPDYIEQLTNISSKVWKAFRIKDENSIKEINLYGDCQGILLDSYVKDQKGGSGKVFNWSLVKELSNQHFTILAGGLNEENVIEAIKLVNPHVIDISSGVEQDGKKNEDMIKSLLRRVKGYDIQ